MQQAEYTAREALAYLAGAFSAAGYIEVIKGHPVLFIEARTAAQAQELYDLVPGRKQLAVSIIVIEDRQLVQSILDHSPSGRPLSGERRVVERGIRRLLSERIGRSQIVNPDKLVPLSVEDQARLLELCRSNPWTTLREAALWVSPDTKDGRPMIREKLRIQAALRSMFPELAIAD